MLLFLGGGHVSDRPTVRGLERLHRTPR